MSRKFFHGRTQNYSSEPHKIFMKWFIFSYNEIPKMGLYLTLGGKGGLRHIKKKKNFDMALGGRGEFSVSNSQIGLLYEFFLNVTHWF